MKWKQYPALFYIWSWLCILDWTYGDWLASDSRIFVFHSFQHRSDVQLRSLRICLWNLIAYFKNQIPPCSRIFCACCIFWNYQINEKYQLSNGVSKLFCECLPISCRISVLSSLLNSANETFRSDCFINGNRHAGQVLDLLDLSSHWKMHILW